MKLRIPKPGWRARTPEHKSPWKGVWREDATVELREQGAMVRQTKNEAKMEHAELKTAKDDKTEINTTKVELKVQETTRVEQKTTTAEQKITTAEQTGLKTPTAEQKTTLEPPLPPREEL